MFSESLWQSSLFILYEDNSNASDAYPENEAQTMRLPPPKMRLENTQYSFLSLSTRRNRQASNFWITPPKS